MFDASCTRPGEWPGQQGINVTMGLPVIRTSVDYVTIFDIAGTS
ncbi:4-hydroxythreonine-4-phosphate dehydrogenase PdxA [Microvirga arsenatis]|uniref:Uncharacterized protein n=1 Tax=Microvirga arsenatis TaxID=2692265 RepID=A0ABW9Z2T6_9HYPH|nr:hypothetical protein [Microvirga arsenatis]NBJ26735.1 hypothetical protein [Microvirga arsenatis]